MRLAVDIGGTFTDVVAYDPRTGAVVEGKAPTTPEGRAEGILQAVAAAGVLWPAVEFLIHGSTVVINALLERKGARTALVTTEGFRDVYEIGRINRPQSFFLGFRKPVPLVPRSWRFEVPERLSAEGEVIRPLDRDALVALGQRLQRLGAEAVAVVFLHAYRNPVHEIEAKAILQEMLPAAFITCSHEVSREYREYERTSTTAANAFVGPGVRQYVQDLRRRMAGAGFEGRWAILNSNGGLMQPEEAESTPIAMMESGPAGGVTGTQALVHQLGIEYAIAFDMGGTTAKAAVIEAGVPRLAEDYFVGGYVEGLPIRIPVLDIVEVGTGGGSIARVAPGGGIRVGPESAGAQPGPVAYGLGGTEPTLTDANLVLGRMDPERFLQGRQRLDLQAARLALSEQIAGRLGLGLEEAADGIVAIAVAQMGHGIRALTTARGLDPQDFTLVAYGGAGPLHAALLAQELYIPRVIVPPRPAVFSALGMVMADWRVDLVRTRIQPLASLHGAELIEQFAQLQAEAAEPLRRASLAPEDLVGSWGADMRYVGQEHTVTVRLPAEVFSDPALAIPRVKQRFDQAHHLRYGYQAPEVPAEIVNLRVQIVGQVPKPGFPELAVGDQHPPEAARLGRREVVLPGRSRAEAVAVWNRAALMAGNRIRGPALIDEGTSVTLLPEGGALEVGRFGELKMEVRWE